MDARGAGEGGAAAPAFLGGTLRRGAVVAAGSLVVTQVIAFAQTMVLARLLSPAEFGLFAAGTVLTGFLVHITEGGLRSALIQRDDLDGGLDGAAETVFRVTAVTGTVLSLLALAAAPVVGWVFDSPIAAAIAAVSAGTLLLYALANVPDALMQRRFDFRRRTIVDPTASAVYAVVAVVAALTGAGVWSMVIGMYASIAASTAVTWVLAGWRPGRGRVSMVEWRRLRRFGFPLVVVEINERLREIAETVLVGRGLDAAALGQYRNGRRIAVLPGVAIVSVCSYVLFPAFARIAGDPVRLRAAYLRALRWIWFAAVPVAGLMVAVGVPLTVVLLGSPWHDAGMVLTAMSGYGLGVALGSVATESIKGCGRSRLLHWMTVTRLVLTLGLLILLLPLGLVGVGLSVSISFVVVGLLGTALAAPVVGVVLREVAALLWPPVLAAGTAIAVVLPLEQLVARSDQRPILIGLGSLLSEALLFLLVYLAVHHVVAPATTRALATALRDRRNRRGTEHVG